MSHSRIFFVLLTCLVAGFPGRTSAKDVGSLTRKVEVVTKAPQGEKETEMRVRDPVREGMEVATGKRSGAEFAIGDAQGLVTMGPTSRFTFEEGLFDGSLLDRVRCRISFGRFWFWFAPPVSKPTVLGRHPREVVIRSGGEDIHLSGTAVFLRVERNGMTTLYVEQGTAVVGEPGEEVRVEPGQWTMFGPGLPPQPPAPIDGHQTTEIFAPGVLEISPPALLDLTSPRLDLPKSGVP
jgi:hypothetical protein